jgi:hypothetical protein
MATHFGYRFPATTHASVTVNTYQHERWNDQQEHEEHHDLRVLADKIKHALYSL